MTDEELIRERGHIEGHLAERLALHISEHYGPISAGSDEFRPLFLEEAKALGYDDDDPVVLIRRESDGVVFEVGVDVTARRVPTEAGAGRG